MQQIVELNVNKIVHHHTNTNTNRNIRVNPEER
jgi:hypothetical protein